MSQTRLSQAGKIKLSPARESLVSDFPAGDGEITYLFLQCRVRFKKWHLNPNLKNSVLKSTPRRIYDVKNTRIQKIEISHLATFKHFLHGLSPYVQYEKHAIFSQVFSSRGLMGCTNLNIFTFQSEIRIIT
jgi:hypothetical protein